MRVFCCIFFVCVLGALLITSTSNLLYTYRLLDLMGNKLIEVNLTTISSETKQIIRSFCHVFSVCSITITLFIVTHCSIPIFRILFLVSHSYIDIRSFL